MKAYQSLFTRRCSLAKPSTQDGLSIVAVCDGLIGAVYAHEAVESLGMALSSDTLIQSSYWSFDMLHPFDHEHLSVRAATRADLVIVSALAAAELPGNVRSWIMTVMRESQISVPVIAAFHPDSEVTTISSSPMCEFLSSVASLWRTDFLCNESFDHQLDRGLAPDLVRRSRRKGFTPEFSCCAPSYSNGFGWGIQRKDHSFESSIP